MSMAEQQVREYLNHSSATESGQQAPLGPAPPPQGSAGVPPPPPGCAGRILSRNANGTSVALPSEAPLRVSVRVRHATPLSARFPQPVKRQFVALASLSRA
ncbi:hypothetical protein MTO96_007173 [Rhipicephalus appendiculatus]